MFVLRLILAVILAGRTVTYTLLRIRSELTPGSPPAEPTGLLKDAILFFHVSCLTLMLLWLGKESLAQELKRALVFAFSMALIPRWTPKTGQSWTPENRPV